MPAKTTSRNVALLVPIIQLILGRAETLPVSVSLVPMFQVGIGLKEWSKLSDVLHVIESKHALDQVRAGCGAENGRHQYARLRDHLELDQSEEHTSELQSHLNLVCRLLLEKKKKNNKKTNCDRH